jgi:hypothetical protein
MTEPATQSDSGRRSYRGLMSLPAWGLYAADGSLLATIARPATEARDLFAAHTARHPGTFDKGKTVRRV